MFASRLLRILPKKSLFLPTSIPKTRPQLDPLLDADARPLPKPAASKGYDRFVDGMGDLPDMMEEEEAKSVAEQGGVSAAMARVMPGNEPSSTSSWEPIDGMDASSQPESKSQKFSPNDDALLDYLENLSKEKEHKEAEVDSSVAEDELEDKWTERQTLREQLVMRGRRNERDLSDAEMEYDQFDDMDKPKRKLRGSEFSLKQPFNVNFPETMKPWDAPDDYPAEKLRYRSRKPKYSTFLQGHPSVSEKKADFSEEILSRVVTEGAGEVPDASTLDAMTEDIKAGRTTDMGGTSKSINSQTEAAVDIDDVNAGSKVLA